MRNVPSSGVYDIFPSCIEDGYVYADTVVGVTTTFVGLISAAEAEPKVRHTIKRLSSPPIR